jgi:hypothetical protein
MSKLPLIRIPFTLLCLYAGLALCGPLVAQSPADLTLARSAAMPQWTVPVLRLVSATHVEPTTGVVLSDDGLVLVPAEFAGPGDEIIVLDGGTDIIRNGRPAKILQRFSTEGVQVLSVPALRRSGASFSTLPLQDGDRVRLHAFPPAELIAQGEPPIDIETTVSVPGENGRPLLSGETPLPNVSGALVDECGHLAGYSSASGVQSMSTAESPRYQWKNTLIRLAGELQINLRMADCRADEAASSAPGPEPEAEIAPEKSAAAPAAIPEPQPQAEPGEPQATDMAQDDSGEPTEDEAASTDPVDGDAESLQEVEILPPIEISAEGEAPADREAPPAEPALPAWVWLLLAMILFGGGYAVHRFRVRTGRPAGKTRPVGQQHLSVQEEAGDAGPVTNGLDRELTCSVELTDGRSFELRCPVSSRAINLTIGRGNADIAIESPAVSRRHAALNGTAAELTLSDLGSSNGTSINGVPCLEGETMYVEPGDVIIVGDARFRFSIGPADKEQATE